VARGQCYSPQIMRNLRLEVMDGGNAIYVTADPDGLWARSTEIDETVTADWDAQGRLIGLELIGSTAVAAMAGMVQGLLTSQVGDLDRLGDVLDKLGFDGAKEKGGK
jgi:hypothetical protein